MKLKFASPKTKQNKTKQNKKNPSNSINVKQKLKRLGTQYSELW